MTPGADRKTIEQMAPWTGEEEKRAVAEYLDGGGWLTEFRKTAELEERIASYVGVNHAVMLSSGTAALFCAVTACGIGPGDEVIVPDFTMIATANAVLLAGAKPVFVDVSPEHLCLDLDAAERAITERTRAILLVSLNGRSPDMRRAVDLCRNHGLQLIEDAAQALGSFHQGKHLGTFGICGILSFSPLKIITTGQGGAVITDDPDVAARVRQMKDFGRSRSGVDYHESIGYNFKFTDLQAVIGIEQMKKLAWRLRWKKEMFRLYRDELEGLPGVRFLDTDLSHVTPWFIDVLVDDREKIAGRLLEHGIKARPFYPPIHSQPAYGVSGHYPVTEDAAARGLWLPSSTFLTDDDVKRVCEEIRSHASV